MSQGLLSSNGTRLFFHQLGEAAGFDLIIQRIKCCFTGACVIITEALPLPAVRGCLNRYPPRLTPSADN